MLALFWIGVVGSRDISFTICKLDIEIMSDAAAVLGLEGVWA